MEEVTPQTNTAPPTAGNSSEQVDWKARVEQLEKEKQGIINDLKSEREKRHAYERAQAAAALPNSVNPPSPAYDPAQVAEAIVTQKLEREKAVRWLARQEKVDPDDIDSAPVMTELQGVIQKYNLQGLPISSGVQTAYKLLLQEREAANKAKAVTEATRDNTIVSQQTASSVSVPPAGSKLVKMSRDEIKKMDWREYQAMKEKAAKSGEQIIVE